jgi:hypothetical protein
MGIKRRYSRSAIARVAMLALSSLMSSMVLHAQVISEASSVVFTTEAYGNVTLGTTSGSPQEGESPDALWFDGAVRELARLHIETGPDFGARVVVEGSNDRVHLSDASVLVFGSAGRLEIGKRMGLPDVLTGYAPNSFTFTSAEFGPASGLSVDPGGGLQTRYLHPKLRSKIEPLAALGVAASLFNDQSTKVLYVSPKHNGWLGGVSFAANADDARFDRLAQAGLVHESYWSQNVWRWGGSFAHARNDGSSSTIPLRDLNSISLGTSVVLDDSLYLGLAASYDAAGGLPTIAHEEFASASWGATVSVNYNSGPWTLGGYCQYATGEGDVTKAGNDRLSAAEVGASYRFTTKLRVYGAWYVFDFINEGQRSEELSGGGHVFTFGIRATL